MQRYSSLSNAWCTERTRTPTDGQPEEGRSGLTKSGIRSCWGEAVPLGLRNTGRTRGNLGPSGETPGRLEATWVQAVKASGGFEATRVPSDGIANPVGPAKSRKAQFFGTAGLVIAGQSVGSQAGLRAGEVDKTETARRAFGSTGSGTIETHSTPEKIDSGGLLRTLRRSRRLAKADRRGRRTFFPRPLLVRR